MMEKRIRPLVVVCVLLAAGCVVATTLAIYFGIRVEELKKEDNNLPVQPTPQPPPPPSPQPPPSPSVEGVYWKAAVAANGWPCSRIGAEVLMEGGSAVDAAIATLLCDGVANPQSMGIGGGFLMTIYSRENRTAVALDARETAPQGASEDMYGGNATLMQKGGLSVAVPGELKGYWEAWSQYGKLEWKRLFQPTVELCEKGIPVNAYVASAISRAKEDIFKNPSLKSILTRQDGALLQEGDIMKRTSLARTLRTIADEGNVASFYGGDLGREFVEDVKEFGGIITIEDLANYSVSWSDPVQTTLAGGYTVHTVPPPGSGPLVTFILNILDQWVPAAEVAVTWQRIVEAFKFAYGRRTELGDPQFVDISDLIKNLTAKGYAADIRKIIEDRHTYNDSEHYGAVTASPENHGTAHISVLAPNGDAVSVTSTINLLFGAKIVSNNTGIILNDEMDDFSAPNITNAYGVPPSPANFIKPGKRPLSSMCPAIITDENGDVRLVTGAAGGTRITTATALSIINSLWFDMTVKESVDARRIHHQIFPMNIEYEEGFSENIIRELESFGHAVEEYSVGGTFVAAIAVNQSAPYQKIFANSDFRRLGAVAGY